MKKITSYLAKTRSYISAHSWTDYLLLSTGIAVFVAVALGNATNASIWFDEGFTAYMSQFSYIEIAQLTAVDVHPPMYYWFIKTWTLLFGTTELAFRSMSIMFGAVTIAGGYLMARRFFGRTVAAASLLFLVLSPMLIRYSDEARMYTMASSIVVGATLALSKAVESKKRSWWVAYGLLVSLGMWTHYFTAVAWIAHWAWRAIIVRRGKAPLKDWLRSAFGGHWFMSYAIAVGLFLPWVPFFLLQTAAVQGGFWIGPVSADTATNYLSNYFYYFEHAQVMSWWVVPMAIVLWVAITSTPRVYKKLTSPEKKNYLLVTSLAWLSPLVLMVVSLPPLRSVFVERYLIPATIFTSIFFAATLVIGTRGWRPIWRAAPLVLTSAMMIVGIFNVYNLGNFNKNSNIRVLTGEVVKEVRAIAPKGTPIVAQSPWVFYEAVYYDSTDYPVYFIDEATNYIYGSLEMLRIRDDHKIKDLEQFKRQHPTFWYIGGTDEAAVPAYQPSWQAIRTVGVADPIGGKTLYKATEYRFGGE